MSAWDTYRARLDVHGNTMREAAKRMEIRRLQDKLPTNLSYTDVAINDNPQSVIIIDTTDLSEKKIRSMPGETLVHGGLVSWEESKWLITELDAHKELYYSGLIKRCNQVVKWVTPEGDTISRWGIVEDGTKYLVGENVKQVATLGDARMALTLAKDSATRRLHTGTRIMLGDPEADQRLAFEITKPNTLYNVYNGEGVYRFILTQVPLIDEDNLTEQVADADGRGFKDPVVTPEEIRETGVYL